MKPKMLSDCQVYVHIEENILRFAEILYVNNR